MANMREAQRECIDAQIMTESGKATGRLDAKITEVEPKIFAGEVRDLLECCKVLRQIGMAQLTVLQRLKDLTYALGRTIGTEVIDNLLVPTRDSKMFIIPGTVTLVPVGSGGGITTIASLIVPEGYMGVVTDIGLQVNPAGGYPDVTWQVASSGDPDPYFAPNGVFAASTLSTPFKYSKVFPSQRTMQLRALNSSAGPLEVSGLMMGFFRPTQGLSVG
jgi:hypothetical protein